VFDWIWVGRVGRDGLGKGLGFWVLGNSMLGCWGLGRAYFMICGFS